MHGPGICHQAYWFNPPSRRGSTGAQLAAMTISRVQTKAIACMLDCKQRACNKQCLCTGNSVCMYQNSTIYSHAVVAISGPTYPSKCSQPITARPEKTIALSSHSIFGTHLFAHTTITSIPASLLGELPRRACLLGTGPRDGHQCRPHSAAAAWTQRLGRTRPAGGPVHRCRAGEVEMQKDGGYLGCL